MVKKCEEERYFAWRTAFPPRTFQEPQESSGLVQVIILEFSNIIVLPKHT